MGVEKAEHCFGCVCTVPECIYSIYAAVWSLGLYSGVLVKFIQRVMRSYFSAEGRLKIRDFTRTHTSFLNYWKTTHFTTRADFRSCEDSGN